MTWEYLPSEKIEAGGFELAEEGVMCAWQRIDFIQVKGRGQTASASEQGVRYCPVKGFDGGPVATGTTESQRSNRLVKWHGFPSSHLQFEVIVVSHFDGGQFPDSHNVNHVSTTPINESRLREIPSIAEARDPETCRDAPASLPCWHGIRHQVG